MSNIKAREWWEEEGFELDDYAWESDGTYNGEPRSIEDEMRDQAKKSITIPQMNAMYNIAESQGCKILEIALSKRDYWLYRNLCSPMGFFDNGVGRCYFKGAEVNIEEVLEDGEVQILYKKDSI